MKKLLSLLLLLSLALSFVGCPAPDDGTDEPTGYTFTRDENGRYVCTETGISYRLSTSVYLPTEISALAYGSYTHTNGAVFSYYKIRNAEPSEYLAHADAEDNFPYGILYSGERMPTLEEMGTEDILICDAEAEFFFREAYIIDRVGSATVVHDAVHAYSIAAPMSAPPTAKLALRVELLFLSGTLPFHYNLAYMQYEDGTAAFYDAGKLAYFPAPFDLFDGYKLKDEAKS